MKPARLTLWVVPLALALVAGGCASNDDTPTSNLVVNSLEDIASPPAGTITLRSAIAAAVSGEAITFDPALDGDTILLTVVGEEHSTLVGEVYVNNAFAGYLERDYGKSALYARKHLVVDASGLPNGITVKWGGGATTHARVLAVYGDLTMKNVTIESGHSEAVAITGGTQPYTLARGGGLAVWGTARLEQLHDRRQHLRRRIRVGPGPRHVRRRHLRQRTRPQELRHQRQFRNRLRCRWRRHLLRRRRGPHGRPGEQHVARPVHGQRQQGHGPARLRRRHLQPVRRAE